MRHFKSAFLIVDALGMITGVFGGLLRDVLCNQIPLVLQREVCASVSLVTGGLYVGLPGLEVNTNVASLSAPGVGFVFRLLAIRYHWMLPRFNDKDVQGFE